MRHQTTATIANAPIEPLGGCPATGSTPSVADLDYQVKYHRAFEAVIWAVPAVALHGFRNGADSVGVKDNDVIAYSKQATPHLETLTANNNTPAMRLYSPKPEPPSILPPGEGTWQPPAIEIAK